MPISYAPGRAPEASGGHDTLRLMDKVTRTDAEWRQALTPEDLQPSGPGAS